MKQQLWWIDPEKLIWLGRASFLKTNPWRNLTRSFSNQMGWEDTEVPGRPDKFWRFVSRSPHNLFLMGWSKKNFFNGGTKPQVRGHQMVFLISKPMPFVPFRLVSFGSLRWRRSWNKRNYHFFPAARLKNRNIRGTTLELQPWHKPAREATLLLEALVAQLIQS